MLTDLDMWFAVVTSKDKSQTVHQVHCLKIKAYKHTVYDSTILCN